MITQITEEQAREMLGQVAIHGAYFEDGIRAWKKCGYIKKSAIEEYQEYRKIEYNFSSNHRELFDIVDRLIEELRSEKE